jgi:hypothetical protein
MKVLFEKSFQDPPGSSRGADISAALEGAPKIPLKNQRQILQPKANPILSMPKAESRRPLRGF